MLHLTTGEKRTRLIIRTSCPIRTVLPATRGSVWFPQFVGVLLQMRKWDRSWHEVQYLSYLGKGELKLTDDHSSFSRHVIVQHSVPKNQPGTVFVIWSLCYCPVSLNLTWSTSSPTLFLAFYEPWHILWLKKASCCTVCSLDYVGLASSSTFTFQNKFYFCNEAQIIM